MARLGDSAINDLERDDSTRQSWLRQGALVHEVFSHASKRNRSEGPSIRDDTTIICAVDTSHAGASGLCWDGSIQQCRYYYRHLPRGLRGGSCRAAGQAELRNLTAAARLWAADWRGRNVLFRCDHPCLQRGGGAVRRQMAAALRELSARHHFSYRLKWQVLRPDRLVQAAEEVARGSGAATELSETDQKRRVAAAVGEDVVVIRQPAPSDDMYELHAVMEGSFGSSGVVSMFRALTSLCVLVAIVMSMRTAVIVVCVIALAVLCHARIRAFCVDLEHYDFVRVWRNCLEYLDNFDFI